MKHKNNQSLDTKIDKHLPGHLKYTTLLSKEKKLNIESKSKTNKELEKETGKGVSKNKYYSAPVSTKENGLVTKFKFLEKNNETLKMQSKESTGRLEDRKYSTGSKGSYKRDKRLKVTPMPSESQLNNIDSKKRSQDSTGDIENLRRYDISMPKNQDIQRIFSDGVNSPSDKVIHMSVINSFDNFEEFKKSSDSERRHYLDNQSDNIGQANAMIKDAVANKAAVPILDFTQLPFKPRKDERGAYDDMEMGSNSIVSIFDQESHLDLSSKRLKKLILTSDFSSLLNLREEAVNKKADREKERLDDLIRSNKISPRTGKARALKLERWISKEKEEIRKAKRIFEEANKNTEDVVKETELNGNFLKQMMSDKVTTPREGHSMRSGMNSSRRRFERQSKQAKSEKDDSEHQERLSSTNSKDYEHTYDIEKRKSSQEYNEKELDRMLEKHANKEIDMTKEDRSDLDVMVSVDTPKADSQLDSSLIDTQKIMLGPKETEGDSSSDSGINDNFKDKPINIECQIKDISSDAKDLNEQEESKEDSEINPQSLSRKKSEQRLSDLKHKFPLKHEDPKAKSTTTPTPHTKSSLTNPFNSNKFFTDGFDDQPMDVAIEHLVNSSGKMGLPTKSDENNEVQLARSEKVKDSSDKQEHSDDTPSDDQSWKVDWNATLNKGNDPALKDAIADAKDDYNLIKQVKKNKIIKVKDSRNPNIKESKNKEAIDKDELDSEDKKKYFGINDDVEFFKKKNTTKKDSDESRNQKKSQQAQQKSSKSNDSYKEDIVIEDVSDQDLSVGEKTDPKNITGSQSLDNTHLVTPKTPARYNDTDYESSDKAEGLENSDSKYATVSILAELNQKELLDDKEELKRQSIEAKGEDSVEAETAKKLTDLIYSAMLAEIKAELFPPRPLFLLTADLDKIELDQALVYLNDMSVEKEAALLKEYLKYSGADDMDLNSWDDDRVDRDSDENKMFSDSGKLVLYERRGISTDLFAIEQYVDELSTEVDVK